MSALRIQTLNPLVAVEAVSAREAVQIGGLENLINGVDLVCVTDSERDTLVST
jgi:ubiquitin-like 1-activating enzyme E1 A